MENNNLKKQSKKLKKINYLFLIIFTIPTLLFSQDYRNAKAYIEDFGKNEMYIKKSLIDYSITLVESQLETRSNVTSTRIATKLSNIIAILKNHDIGFDDNVLLRDSFIRMNEKTIACLNDGTLILNDYDTQSLLSIDKIMANLIARENKINEYFDELRRYEKTKIEFGQAYNLNIRNYNDKNVFEYDARQNIIFYKLNIIDQKLLTLIKDRDKDGFFECAKKLDQVYQEAISKTILLKNIYTDNTLNDANIEYANFIYNQKEKLTPLFTAYIEEYEKLEKLKKLNLADTKESIEEYNTLVRSYNFKKNLFVAVLNEIQFNKKMMYERWFVTNGAFLKNNIEFENIHEQYSIND